MLNLQGSFRSSPFAAPASDQVSRAARGAETADDRARLALDLLRLAAQERSGQSAEAAGAWTAGLFSDRGGEARDWQAFAGRLEAFADSEANFATLRRLAAEAPASDSGAFDEVLAVLQESEPRLLAESLLSLGRRRFQDMPALASRVLHEAASASPEVAPRARALLDAAEGRGSFGAQLEFQLPRFTRELASPLMLASFGSGILLSRAASLAVLSRCGRFGWRSLLASEGAALAVEAPAMVLSHRLGHRLFYGSGGPSSAEGLGPELLSAYATFGLLRFTGNALAIGGPSLRRGLGLRGAWGQSAITTIGLGAELGAVVAGHRLSAELGLAPPAVSGSQALFDGVLTLAHMKLAGRLVDRLGFARLRPEAEFRRLQLLRASHEGLFARPAFAPELSFAGLGRPGRLSAESRDPLRPEPLFMSAEGEGSGAPPTGGGSRPKPSGRKAALLQILSQNLDEYSQAASHQDTMLARAARRLHTLLDRAELERDPEFARELAKVELELREAGEHDGAAKRSWERLKVFFGRGSAPEEAVLPREVAEQEGRRIESDEQQRGALRQSLEQMSGILKKVSKVGWTEELQAQASRATQALNRVYQNSSTWRIPGLDRILRRSVPEALLQRRQGAVLGLAALNGGRESAVLRRLRDPEAPASAKDDFELELVHQSVLLAARRQWEPGALDAELTELAGRYGASEESAAAMRLTGATIQRFVEAEPRSVDVVEWLRQRPDADIFGDRFHHMLALRGMKGEPGDGLHLLSHDSAASDYFFTGLQLYSQTRGESGRLAEGLQRMQQRKLSGFHPSLAASLFGAAHGRKNLPPRLWNSDLPIEEFLARAFSGD